MGEAGAGCAALHDQRDGLVREPAVRELVAAAHLPEHGAAVLGYRVAQADRTGDRSFRPRTDRRGAAQPRSPRRQPRRRRSGVAAISGHRHHHGPGCEAPRGHHRVRDRPSPRARAAIAPRTAGASLGAVRGRPSARGDAARQTTPTTATPQSASVGWTGYFALAVGAGVRQPCLPGGLAQTAQAQLPNAARTRRGVAATRTTNLATARQALRHPDAPRLAPGKVLPSPAGGRPSDRAVRSA